MRTEIDLLQTVQNMNKKEQTEKEHQLIVAAQHQLKGLGQGSPS